MFAIVVTPPSPVHKGMSGSSSASYSPSSTPSMDDEHLMKLSPSVQHFLQQQQQHIAIPQTRRPGERSLVSSSESLTLASGARPHSAMANCLPSSDYSPPLAASSLCHSAPSSSSFSSLCSSSAATLPLDLQVEEEQLVENEDEGDGQAVVRRKVKRKDSSSPVERFPSVLFPNSVSTDRHGYLLPPPNTVNLRSISHNDSFWCGYDSKESMSATAAAAAESEPRWDEVIDTAVIFAHLALNKQCHSHANPHSHSHAHAQLHSHLKPSLSNQQQPHMKRLHTHAYNHDDNDNRATASSLPIMSSASSSMYSTQANQTVSHAQLSNSSDDCDCECDIVEQVKSIHTDEDLDDALRDI